MCATARALSRCRQIREELHLEIGDTSRVRNVTKGGSTMTHTAVRLAMLSVLGTAASTAAAQDNTAQAPPGTLEEVTVTAQRREQSLQSVPISVTALTADAMNASGISDLADLSVVTPGLVMTGSRGSSTPVPARRRDAGGRSRRDEQRRDLRGWRFLFGAHERAVFVQQRRAGRSHQGPARHALRPERDRRPHSRHHQGSRPRSAR